MDSDRWFRVDAGLYFDGSGRRDSGGPGSAKLVGMDAVVLASAHRSVGFSEIVPVVGIDFLRHG